MGSIWAPFDTGAPYWPQGPRSPHGGPALGASRYRLSPLEYVAMAPGPSRTEPDQA